MQTKLTASRHLFTSKQLFNYLQNTIAKISLTPIRFDDDKNNDREFYQNFIKDRRTIKSFSLFPIKSQRIPKVKHTSC